jgi:hypothetical protein
MTRTEELAELLLPAKYPKRQLEQALERSNEDVGRAAEILLLGIGPSKQANLGGWLKPKSEGIKKKRKRSRGSDDELKPEIHRTGPVEKEDTEPIVLSSDEEECLILGAKTGSLKKPANLSKIPQPSKILSLATLQQAPSPPKRNIAQPPIVLTTPSSISSTLPCSLVPSPLSAEFATALYLSLVEESKKEEVISEIIDAQGNKSSVITQAGFRRHKWFLNGRSVVSPHTSGYYRLSEEEGGVESGGEYCKPDVARCEIRRAS